jgi:hypothetical protein
MATPHLTTYQQVYTTDQFGNISLTGIVDIKDFSTVNFEIFNWPNPVSDPNSQIKVVVSMGKISGWTLAQRVDEFPILNSPVIKSYKVVAPELSIGITGAPANTIINIEAWLFLK